MTVEVFNLSTNINKFKKIVDKIVKITGEGEYLSHVIWDSGEIMRDNIQIAMTSLVYMSPELKYKRTLFLLNSVYLTTAGKTDRASAFAKAFAGAVQFKSRSGRVAQNYRFAPHVPYNWKRAIRVTAGAEYAAYVEYGGNNNRGPRPFMRTGATTAQREILEFMKVQYESAMNQIAHLQEPRYHNYDRDYS